MDILQIALFVGAICLPTFDQVFRSADERGPEPEGRAALAAPNRPQTAAELAQYPSAFERHYEDTFGLRDVLLRWNSLVHHYVFVVGPSHDIVPYSRDWICYAGNCTFEVARGLMPFSPEQLDGWCNRIENRHAALAESGVKYLFVVVPNKETIYPERVPAAVNRLGPTRLDQLVQALADRHLTPIVDMRPAFLRAKAEDREGDYLYNPLGTHWSGRGSKVAYYALMEAIGEQIPSAVPLTESQVVVQQVDSSEDSWAGRMYIDDVLRQSQSIFIPTPGYFPTALENSQLNPGHLFSGSETSGGPRVLIYHDSFLPLIDIPLAASFEVLESCVGNEFSIEDVEKSGPDIVIEMFVERALVNYNAVEPRVRAPEGVPGGNRRSWNREVVLGGAGDSVSSQFLPDSATVPNSLSGGATSKWFEAPSPAWLTFDFEVQSDREDSLDLYWRSDRMPDFDRKHRKTFSLHVGSNHLTGSVRWQVGSRGQIMLRKPGPDGTVRIQSLEVATLAHPQ